MVKNEANDTAIAHTVQNAKQMPKVFYGLHFYPGVAEYPGVTEDGTPNRILVTEDAIRAMESTFTGRPIYVNHIEGTPRLPTLEYEADGYIIESFFNKADGKHWAKMLIITDEAHEALAKGWKLSNAYKPNLIPKNGVWNSVPYQHEVTGGEFEHMAIVETPRYNESVILTPLQFSEYNERCLSAVKRVDNSAFKPIQSKTPGVIEMAFNLFKKTAVEAEPDIMVTLKNGKTISIEELIAIANDQPETQPSPILSSPANKEDKSEDGEAKGKGPDKEEKTKQGEGSDKMDGGVQMANLDHHVTVNGASMKLGDLMGAHQKMSDCMNSIAEHYGSMMKGDKSEAKDIKAEDKTENDSEEAPGDKAEAKDIKAEDKTAKNSAEDNSFIDGMLGLSDSKKPDWFSELKNAAASAAPIDAPRMQGIELGKSRYGAK